LRSIFQFLGNLIFLFYIYVNRQANIIVIKRFIPEISAFSVIQNICRNYFILSFAATLACIGNDELALRIATIRHHLKIESRIVEGSNNVVRMLESAGKQADKRALQEVLLLCSC